MGKRTSLRPALLVALALWSAGCASGVSPTPAPPTPQPAVPAGQYTTAAFTPAVTFTLPDGWVIATDSGDYVGLRPAGSQVTGIYLFRNPSAASQDIDCPLAAAPGVGTSAADLAEWIAARPGLVVSQPMAVTVGGLEGIRIDVRILEGWLASCPFAERLATVPLFVSPTDAGFRWVIAGSERLRLDLLDVPAGGTVVVDIDAFEGSLMDAFLPDAARIVASMSFAAP